MNVFIIPSWYPSESQPSTGIFFREQAVLIAKYRADVNVGVSLWGSHEPALWLKASQPFDSVIKYSSKPLLRKKDTSFDLNLAEFFTPAYTWTRKIGKGNINGIIAANRQNFERYSAVFGHPEIIHAHVAYPAGAVAMDLSRKYGIPYLITEHMSPFPMPSFKGDFKKTVLPPLKNASKVLAVSQSLSDRLKTFGIRSDRVSNFIDDSFFIPKEQEGHNFTTMIAVGRLEEQKNYPLMLRVMKALEDFPCQLKIVGDGSQRKQLQKLAVEYGVEEKVSWVGEGDREMVRNELQNADVFINTSLHENQPVAILEALACGLPVITTAWSGAEELIDEEVGAIVDSENPEQFAEAIVSESTRRKKTGELIRQRFDERFATKRQVDLLVETYVRLIS